MSNYELVSKGHELGGPVGLAMAPGAFDLAVRAGIRDMQANIPAMRAIAAGVGFIKDDQPLPPLLLVMHSTEPGRNRLSGTLDARLPEDLSDPQTGRYHSAEQLSETRPASAPRETLLAYAHYIGAAALTQIAVESFEPGTTHVGAFAIGLTNGQRPLELQPRPGLATRGLKELRYFAGREGQGPGLARRLVQRQPPMQEPFDITYDPTPRLHASGE